MFQFRINDEFDELLELCLGRPKNQFQILLAESLSIDMPILLQKSKHIRSRDVTLTSPVDALKQHHRTEFLQKPLLEVESEIEEVSLGLHESLFCSDQCQEKFAE